MRIDFEKIESGFVGEVVNAVHSTVEANKESILIQFLACFGNCIGRTAHFVAAEDRHYANLFVVIVGQSSRGRKGQALNAVKALFDGVDDEWFKNRVKKGLASGEGLISHIKDANPLNESDPFNLIEDKRLLSTESEFSSVLKVSQREGNILSQILRDSWDGVKLQTLTKINPITATDPMVSIIGHITDAELLKFMCATEIANGLGNRFMYVRAKKDKSLPDPEPLEPALKTRIQSELRARIHKAKSVGRMEFTRNAKTYWDEFYGSLNDKDLTVVGMLTSRQEPQVRRLAMIISLVNGLSQIDVDSLVFAEKIFNYSIETLREIYGHSFGDAFTDRLYDLLKQTPEGLSRSQIQDRFSRNYLKGNLDHSLGVLKSQGLANLERIPTTGRPIERWFIL